MEQGQPVNVQVLTEPDFIGALFYGIHFEAKNDN